MKNYKLHTPDGVRDFLPNEFLLKNQIELRIQNVFDKYGYLPLSGPLLEYADVFEDSGASKKMYKLIDRNGDILTLRPDMTPAIARMTATKLAHCEPPLRFSYVEKVFRQNESYQGKQREITQAGVELIGVNSFEADCEVIAVAINSLLAAGFVSFKVDLGHSDFIKAVLDDTDLRPADKQSLMAALVSRNYVEVESIINKSRVDSSIKSFFNELPLYIGNVKIIEKAYTIIKNRKAVEALSDLANIYVRLCEYGFEDYILFDLGMIGHSDYYTGVIFRGYINGVGFSVVDGGRYDNLIAQYGEGMPSVGFAIGIDSLVTAYESQNISFPSNRSDTLLVFTEEGRDAAVTYAEELRSQGLIIENSLLGSNLEENIAYAKRKKTAGIIYFENADSVVMIDVDRGIRRSVKIGELVV